jgi:hypothetical protein
MNQFDRQIRSKQRPHSSYNNAIYGEVPAVSGVPLRCQHCSGQIFRRSSLRASDFKEILFMRYPVRCTRCSQRQMVSFTVAGISLSSSIKPQKPVTTSTHWSELPPGNGSRTASDSTHTDPE